MNLHVRHDAAVLARLSGAAIPACEGIIIKHGDPSNVLASIHAGNPLGADWLADLDAPSPRIIAWSGTMATNLFESEPRNWMKPGKEAFGRFCDDVCPQLVQHHRRVCFLPHARHVLNDAPSCLTFLRDRATQPFEIALAPASMLEPTMLDRAEDHLTRLFESLGGVCAMVLLCDAAIVDAGEGESRCESVPLGEGVLPREVLRRLLAAHVPDSTPIVIDGRAGGESIRRQVDWLVG